MKAPYKAPLSIDSYHSTNLHRPCLHQSSKTHSKPTHQDTKSIHMPYTPSQQLSRITGRSGSIKRNRRGSIRRRLRRRSRRRLSGNVDTNGVLSTTRVIRSASALTHRVGTLGNTLIIRFSAGKVRQGLWVLRGVRRKAVAALTHVVEGFLN